MRVLSVLVITTALLAGTAAAAPTPQQAGLDEVFIYDSLGRGRAYERGLAMQRFGLMDAKGRPKTKDGKLVPIVSADGKKKAFDMNGEKFADGIAALKEDGATLILVTHGNVGEIKIDQKYVPGFGTGTGKRCKDNTKPVKIGRKLTNVTIYLVVCKAAAFSNRALIRSVKTTMVKDIEANGGSVKTIWASKKECVTGGDTATTPPRDKLDQQKLAELHVELKRLVLGNTNLIKHFDLIQGAYDKVFGQGKVTLDKLTYSAEIPGHGTIQSARMSFAIDNCSGCSLIASPDTLRAATGGTQTFAIDAGPSRAGQFYLMLGSLSGISPGLPLAPEITLPLNPDPYFWLVVGNPNTFIRNSFGRLSTTGRATAAITLPGFVTMQMVGERFRHAYLTLDLTTVQFTFGSSPSHLVIVR